jgi:hypothetical protein
MAEEQRVSERLERIEALRRGRASGRVLLAELRGLLEEGEACFAAEAGGVRGAASVAGLPPGCGESGEVAPRA